VGQIIKEINMADFDKYFPKELNEAKKANQYRLILTHKQDKTVQMEFIVSDILYRYAYEEESTRDYMGRHTPDRYAISQKELSDWDKKLLTKWIPEDGRIGVFHQGEQVNLEYPAGMSSNAFMGKAVSISPSVGDILGADKGKIEYYKLKDFTAKLV
jgi:hypothetical protein